MAYGDDMLSCNKCKELKPLSDFFKESSIARGYRYSCKQCEASRFSNYRNKPGMKEKMNQSRRAWYRKKNYNFSPELYKTRLLEQNNACAICRVDTPGGRGQFHADHDHNTNQPRGVLCHNCNVALGNFKDNLEILKAAIEYLEKYAEVK